MDTSLIVPVAPDAPQNFAVAGNDKARYAVPLMLPVPDSAPTIVVDSKRIDPKAFPFSFLMECCWRTIGFRVDDIPTVFFITPTTATSGAMAFRILSGNMKDSFILLVREGHEETDSERLRSMIAKRMAEPIEWSNKHGGKSAPVIELRSYKYQRKAQRTRLALVAVHIEGDEGTRERTTPSKPTGNHSPRPLVTA